MSAQTSTVYRRIAVAVLIAAAVPLYAESHLTCGAAPPNGQDIFTVGEVRTAILDEQTFRELNGHEWVLMDGRSLKGANPDIKPYVAHLRNDRNEVTIPDARGRFLRMANNGASVDPFGERALGSAQGDSVREHDHEYNDVFFSYNKDHISQAGAVKVDILEDGNRNNVGTHRAWDRDNDGIGWDRTTQVTGDAESRPKNIAVNYFLKICWCRTPACR